MDEADVYFVDTRNAAATVRDTRVNRPTAVISPRQPVYVPPAVNGTRVSWAPNATTAYAGPATFAGPAYMAPPSFYPQGFLGGGQPTYFQPPWGWGQPGTLGGLFAGLNGVNLGSLVELIGQGFAAIRSLPTPPTASGESGIDVANLTLYQQALAEHGKTDEQIRTAVHIIGKLLGA
ncbi:MAG TPA: hypothetical protein VFT22_36375 [Kofleriaceae bacterium]|nr:hypothetical protein [Kofleriaceae bacterium]